MKIQYSATLLSIMIASSSCTLFPGSANEPNDPNSPNDSGSTSSAIVQVDSTGSNTGTDTGTNTSTATSAFVANTAVATSTATQTAMSESTDGGLPTVVVVTVVVTVNLEDAGVSVALAPNADPPADPDAGMASVIEASTFDTGTTPLVEAASPVIDAGIVSDPPTIIFADTIPDAGTEASVPEASTLPPLVAVGGYCCSAGSVECYGVNRQIAPFGLCQTGLTCVFEGPGVAQCYAPSELGGPCNIPTSGDFSQNNFCDVGLTCLGHPCIGSNTNCSGGLPLDVPSPGASTCIVPRTFGEPCIVNGDCAVNIPGACASGDGGLTCQF